MLLVHLPREREEMQSQDKGVVEDAVGVVEQVVGRIPPRQIQEGLKKDAMVQLSKLMLLFVDPAPLPHHPLMTTETQTLVPRRL